MPANGRRDLIQRLKVKCIMKLGRKFELNYLPVYEDLSKITVEHITGFMVQKVLHHLN